MSLFSNAQPAGQTLGQAGAQTASPFGKPTPQTPTLSLFNTTQQNAAPSLFGQPQQQQQQQQQQQGAGLFGNPQRKTSIFGGSLNVPQTSLFGGQQQQQQQQQQQGTSLFGGSTQQRPSLSLFGGSNQQPQQPQQASQSLFGAQPANTSGQQQLGGSLFGNLGQQTAAQSQTSMFGASQPQQQQMGSSIFGTSLAVAPVARTKSVPEQMKSIYEKWEPSSPTCAFQHYFYNQVPEERAPFYAPSPEDDGQKWEEALKKKPTAGSIPVLAKGPLAVGRRLEIQAAVVRAVQARLHEINQILGRLLQAHELRFSVRVDEARRRHVALGRRCLSLAAKVQVLRNRGYNLDGAEEKLLAKLSELNRGAFDPMLSGRQEEIWARMSVLRERAQVLKRETDGLAKDVKAAGENPLDDESMKKVQKILSNYEAQLAELQKELSAAEKDFGEWQAATAPPNT